MNKNLVLSGSDSKWLVLKMSTGEWIALAPRNQPHDERVQRSKWYDTHAEALAYAVRQAGQ